MAKAFFRSIRSGNRKLAITQLNSIARKEIEQAIDKKIKPPLLKSHERIVANWKNKPDFQAKKVIRPDSIGVYVFPTGENKMIWIYVDQGTRPHVILPKRAPRLRFKTGYIPKTLARPARTVAGGGRATGDVVFAKRVNHPGSEGREFTKQIAKDIEPDFKNEIENAFRRTARLVNREV